MTLLCLLRDACRVALVWLAPLLLLSACGYAAQTTTAATTSTTATTEADSSSPPSQTHDKPFSTTQQNPTDVLRHYVAALNGGDYATAQRLWGGNSNACASSDVLRQQMAGHLPIEITIVGPTGTDGAAGSIYATVPIQVAGGSSRTRECVLRRVNDVDGSSAWDRQWHLYRCDLVH